MTLLLRALESYGGNYQDANLNRPGFPLQI